MYNEDDPDLLNSNFRTLDAITNQETNSSFCVRIALLAPTWWPVPNSSEPFQWETVKTPGDTEKIQLVFAFRGTDPDNVQSLKNDFNLAHNILWRQEGAPVHAIDAGAIQLLWCCTIYRLGTAAARLACVVCLLICVYLTVRTGVAGCAWVHNQVKMVFKEWGEQTGRLWPGVSHDWA